MLSQTADYALRAVVALAQGAPDSMTTEEIATKTKVPRGYLSKVLQQLARKGIIASRRGVHGGYVLAMPAAQLTLLPIINAIDPVKHITACPLHLRTHEHQLCPLHASLDEAACAMERVAACKTVADLLADATRPIPLRETVTPAAGSAG